MPKRQVPQKDEVRLSLIKSMRRWGINPNSPDHAKFGDLAVKKAINIAESTRSEREPRMDGHQKTKFPTDLEDAILVVFKENFLEYVDDPIFCRLRRLALVDKLEGTKVAVGVPLQTPPFVVYGHNQGLTSKRKKAFAGVPQKYLDPLWRFNLEKRYGDVPVSDLVLANTWNDAFIEGNASEALVACHAIHNAACYNCLRRNCLEWSGGAKYGWRDLYCKFCQSCYEIKSKRDQEAMERATADEGVLGGSFLRWCKERFPGRTKGTDYLVLVSREATCLRSGSWARKVTIAEIEAVMPNATPFTFASHSLKEDISLKTMVRLKQSETWFSIPFKSRLDLDNIFVKAFFQVFPEAPVTYDESEGLFQSTLGCDQTGKEQERGDQNNESRADVSETSSKAVVDLEALKSELEGLSLDWEGESDGDGD